jgi:hypothetical protein
MDYKNSKCYILWAKKSDKCPKFMDHKNSCKCSKFPNYRISISLVKFKISRKNSKFLEYTYCAECIQNFRFTKLRVCTQVFWIIKNFIQISKSCELKSSYKYSKFMNYKKSTINIQSFWTKKPPCKTPTFSGWKIPVSTQNSWITNITFFTRKIRTNNT